MLGVICGDIVGSVYEFKRNIPYQFTPLFHDKAKITDDTVCSIAVMDALLNNTDATQALHFWCRKYFHIGGWGKRYVQWLASNDPQPYGSAGNGSAMRIASVGWVARTEEEVLLLADKYTAVTHNHPDGMAAARATSLAVYFARHGVSQAEIKQRLSHYYDLNFTINDIRDAYQRTELAKDSVPQAIVCALEATSLEDAIRLAVSLGGDADTQAAIAGGIAEALFGVDDAFIKPIKQRLNNDMWDVVLRFYRRFLLDQQLPVV